MAWTIEFTEFALKQIRKIDKALSKKIINYLKDRVLREQDPRIFGRALLHDKSGLWRYHVENFRIICKIQDEQLKVLVIRIGHRKEIYD